LLFEFYSFIHEILSLLLLLYVLVLNMSNLVKFEFCPLMMSLKK